MSELTKLHFYTKEEVGGGFCGYCKEISVIKYGPKNKRDTALSGAKRMVKKFKIINPTPPKEDPNDPVEKANKKKVNKIFFLLDTSCSMHTIINEAINALNNNISKIREQAFKTGQTTIISVITFNSEIKILIEDLPVELVKKISYDHIIAKSTTALRDAVCQTYNKESANIYPDDVDCSCLIITITDGNDNSSTHGYEDVKNIIRRGLSAGNYTFTFLVPGKIQKRNIINEYGIPAGNVEVWYTTSEGIREYEKKNEQGLESFFVARSCGMRSIDTFYTNLQSVTIKDLKEKLSNVQYQFRILEVKKEINIEDFCKEQLGKYEIGSAYYQLTKREKMVQPYKNILIREKGNKAIYAGNDARKLLNIPINQNVRLIPGNHHNFDVFIQSNSVNRKLVRGTKLLVKIA